MDVSNLTYPDTFSAPSEPLVAHFETLVWYNSEVCNNCFQQIRAVGDEFEKRIGTWTLRLNEYYERTEHGSQEYDPFLLPSDRYGQCYCLECGADTKAENEDLSLEQMTARGVNLVRYIDTQTDTPISGRVMTRTVRELKRIPENGGYDSEIFCVATCRAIKAAKPTSTAKGAVVG